MTFCKLIVFVFSLLFVSESNAQNKVTAHITNFRNNKGICQVCLFDNPAAFKGTTGEPVACKRVKVEHKTVKVVFESLPTGNYAIMTFHDSNSNNEMDTNFLGIPTEGYGASKNNLPFAAAPTFNGNKFSVGPNSIINLSIRLRNL